METTTAIKKITLAPLPYEKTALAPHISEETLTYHHDKHMAAYVGKLNELIAGTQFEGLDLCDIVRRANGAVFNNAAQAWNHEFYFAQFSPAPLKTPSGPLAEAIAAAFGDTGKLMAQMTEKAVGLFGSGWVWLAADDSGRLSIESKPNAGNPLTDGLHPLIAIDVWEHAYYIDFRNVRADGVKALWNVLDWRTVENRYAAIGKTHKR